MSTSSEAIGVGILGAGGNRSSGFRLGFQAHERASVHAVCDVDPESLRQAEREFDAETTYDDYEAMLADPEVDAVVVATPQHLHASQAVAALERDVHVLSEVPAADSMEGAKRLAAAAEGTDAVYMMGENTTYFRENVLVRELVEAGLFGEPYYAEGNYIHETRDLLRTTWRSEHRIGANGITYPTHQFGPVLQWLGDDRVDRVTCAGSGHHYTDELGDCELEDTTTLLGKTVADRLVKVRLDMMSNRPTPERLNQYQLQGTDGYYESPIGSDEMDKVWLQEHHETDDPHDRDSHDLREFEAEFLPERYRDPPEQVADADHFGADYFQVVDFVDSVVGDIEVPIDVHRALDMTLPGLASREAIETETWVDVPDSRTW